LGSVLSAEGRSRSQASQALLAALSCVVAGRGDRRFTVRRTRGGIRAGMPPDARVPGEERPWTGATNGVAG